MINKTIVKLIKAETERQNRGLELIASENYPSIAVRSACGTILMDKYAEGYPGKRYYGGCSIIDQVETIAIQQVCQLFHCSYANVQPHSGSQANAAMYKAVSKYLNLDHKVKILTLQLNDGGHLTHGSPVSFSSEYYDFCFYPLDPTGHLSLQLVEESILKEKPDVLMVGYSAYPYEFSFQDFGALAKKYKLFFIADIAHIAGLVAAGEHPQPFPYCDIVTTTTHKTLRGPRGGMILWNNKELSKYINDAVFPWSQGGPNEAIIAGKAQMAIEAQTTYFRQYIQNVKMNTKLASDTLTAVGCVCSGTDNHLFLVNTLKTYGLTGKIVEDRLGKVGITVNKNMIPGDTLSPNTTSGIRIGLAALTTRGITPKQVQQLFQAIHQYLLGQLTQEEMEILVKRIVRSLKKIQRIQVPTEVNITYENN